MENPLVSIIIPTYNRAYLIGETLDSVMAQSYINWECIVVDDGSTDNTAKILSDYCLKDRRFQYYQRPKARPKGANACRNYGFEMSNGSFINWFDSDDIMHVDFVKVKLQHLLDNIKIDFCACINYTFTKGINEKTLIEKPLIMKSSNYIEDFLFNGLYFYTPSPLWKKTFLKGKLLFDENLHRSQESDFHFRMLLENPTYKYIEDKLFYIRLGGPSISKGANSSLKAQHSIFRYFDKIFNELYQRKEIKNQNKLKQYVLYRQAVNFFNIVNLTTSSLKHLKYNSKLALKIMWYAFSTKIESQFRLKLCVGLVFVFLFKKGYTFLYFPKYNYRKYNH
jgi:glycosyltransferase involved in cell wall biosynthesis